MRKLIKRKFDFHYPDFNRKFGFHYPDFNRQAALVFKPLLTIEEAALYSGLSTEVLYHLIKDGTLSYRKVDNRYYVSRLDLDLLDVNIKK